MGNKRKKSPVTIRKNVEEMREKLVQMEAELEAAKEARYATVGMYFCKAFENCTAFDVIGMSDGEMWRFIDRAHWYYESQARQNRISEVPEITDDIWDEYEDNSICASLCAKALSEEEA